MNVTSIKKIEGNFQESMKGLFGAFYFSQKNNHVFHRFSKAAIVGLFGQSMVTPSESMPVSVSIFRACNFEAFWSETNISLSLGCI